MVTEAPAPAPACGLPDPQGGEKAAFSRPWRSFGHSARQIRKCIPVELRRVSAAAVGCSARPAPNETLEVVVLMPLVRN